MGSLCTSGPATTNTTSTTTPTGINQLNDIWNKVSSAASTPYQAYTGQLVAGLNPTQTAGISNVSNAAGTASPYFDLASQYGKTGAAAINPNDVSKYMNPYTQSVIDATQANFNEGNQQQQQQLRGNAAKQGALGGDRVGVAQAELARQQKLAQDPTIAGLQQQNYTQALGAAQQDRAAQAQGAYTFGSLAPAIQNTAIQGGTAQIGAGTVAQQNQQQQLSADYQQYLNKLAFPYQNASFLAQYGLPTATSMGATTNSQQQQYAAQPSIMQQIMGGAGLGVAAYDAFGGGSGSGGYATSTPNSPGAAIYTGNPTQAGFGPTYSSGGRVGMNRGGRARHSRRAFADGGFVDQVNTIRQALRGGGPVMDMSRGPGGVYSMHGYAGGGQVDENYVDGSLPWSNIFSNVQPLAPPHATPLAAPQAPTPAPAQSQGGGSGDLVKMAMKILPMVLNRGGRVGYADGGDVAEMPFDDRFPYAGDISSGADAMANQRSVSDALRAFGAQSTMAPQPGPVAANVPMPPPRPAMAGAVADASPYSALPPQITNPGGGGGDRMMPSSVSAYDGAQPPSGGLRTPPDVSPAMLQPPMGRDSQAGSARGALGLSDDARMALLSASLGILGSKSSNALGALGEGGQQGIKQYTEAKNARQKNEMEARRLIQQAEQFSQTFGLHKDQFAETKNQHKLEGLKPVKIGVDSLGQDILGIRDPSTGQFRNPITGKPIELPPDIMSPTPRNPNTPTSQAAPGSDDEASLPPNARPTAGHAEGTNPEVLNNLPPEIANKVRGIAEGRQSLQTVPMKQRTAVQNLVNAYDPTFDQSTWTARNAMNRDIAVGNTGKLILASNQLLPHLKTASDKAAELNNKAYPAANTIANWWITATGDPRVKEFDTVRTVAATDAARLLRGSGAMSLEEIRGWEDRLKSAGSPAQLQGVLALLGDDLIGARMSSIEHQYRMVMRKDPPKLMSKDAEEALAVLRSRNQDKGGGGTGGVPPGAIEKLRANPKLAPAFDAQYGEGAAKRALGQ